MKYKSTLFDAARNKIGSIVASENRNGNYFRAKVTPHNPKSAKQLAVRSQFASLSAAWRSLTDVQRAGWTALSALVTLHDPLGNTYHPTGQQLFVGNNANLANIGQPLLTTAPASPDPIPSLSVDSVVATVETAAPHTHNLTVTITADASWEGGLIEATAQYSAGRSFVGRSQFRVVEQDANLPSQPYNLTSEYEALFGSLSVGAKLSTRVTGITTHGFTSAPIRSDVIVTAV